MKFVDLKNAQNMLTSSTFVEGNFRNNKKNNFVHFIQSLSPKTDTTNNEKKERLKYFGDKKKSQKRKEQAKPLPQNQNYVADRKKSREL